MNHTVINIARIDIYVPSPGVLLQSSLQEFAAPSSPPDEPADTVFDASTGLMWSRITNAVDKTWTEAKAAAAAVTLGGFNDWRLPTRKELLSLVDDTRYKPAIDTTRFDCSSDAYWSSTPYASSPSVYAWGVGFYYGDSLIDLQYDPARVRAVRSVAPSASGQ